MSRHLIRDDRQFEVIVGWDPPLQTLFLQVYDKSMDEDLGPRVWRGVPPDVIHDLQRLRTITSEWASLSDAMVGQLAKEMDEPSAL